MYIILIILCTFVLQTKSSSHQEDGHWLVANKRIVQANATEFVIPHLVFVLHHKYSYQNATEVCSNLGRSNTTSGGYQIMLISSDYAYPQPNYYVQELDAKLYDSDYMTGQAFVCSSPLQSAIVMYRNGTTSQFNVSAEAIPSYCYPQAEMNAEYLDKYAVALCVLVRKKIC